MWKNRNVWIVLAGEFIAGLGLWMSIIANLEFMQQKVPSDFNKSLILFAGLLAGVLFGPLAGRVIDTTSKKKVLLISGAGRLVSVSFMFVALYFDSIWWMVLFAVTLQISAAFYFPALQSVIPLIVKERELLALNGVHMNAGTIARILGTTLAGLMLTVMSLQGLYVASFVAYVALLASTAFLNVPEPDLQRAKGADEGAAAVSGGEPEQAESGRRGSDPAGQAPPAEQSGFKALLPLLRSEPIVLTVLWLTLVPTLFIGGFNLMVINISELQHDAQVKGLLYAVEGISFILAGFLVKWMADRGGLMNRLFLFAAIVAAAQCLLFFADSKLCALLSFGLFGLAAGGFFPAAATLFQKQIPKAYHGRFFSFRSMLDRVVFQVVLLSTGLLLDLIGLQLMVLVYGVLSFLLVAIFAVREARSAKKDQAEASF
ncbi:MFS transporter [Paenibacillus tyrfis]|uniref:MFS transporter n=1 Tax=Paenibacillus tyrfis TaxID=1501230 RepID=UPI000B5926A0|nr:MFS transporter [Paenibacillus tyrfis]